MDSYLGSDEEGLCGSGAYGGMGGLASFNALGLEDVRDDVGLLDGGKRGKVRRAIAPRKALIPESWTRFLGSNVFSAGAVRLLSCARSIPARMDHDTGLCRGAAACAGKSP